MLRVVLAIVTLPPAMPTAAGRAVAVISTPGVVCIMARRSLQFVDALDLNADDVPALRTTAPDVGIHGGEVGHLLGLLGRVPPITVVPLVQDGDLRTPAGAGWLPRSAWLLQDDPELHQLICPGYRLAHLPVGGLEAGAHGAEPVYVEVLDGRSPKSAPASNGIRTAPAPAQQESEHDHRRPHALEQVVGAGVVQLRRRRGSNHLEMSLLSPCSSRGPQGTHPPGHPACPRRRCEGRWRAPAALGQQSRRRSSARAPESWSPGADTAPSSGPLGSTTSSIDGVKYRRGGALRRSETILVYSLPRLDPVVMLCEDPRPETWPGD